MSPVPPAPSVTRVDVEGGHLAVARWGPQGAPAAIAAHGITSHHMAWSLVGERLADRGLGLVAPDLRGRGDSMDPGSDSSLAQHSDDLVTVARALDLPEPGVLVGHSMGGFVAALSGVRHPDAWSAIVMIDGGPPLSDPLPPGTDVEAVLLQVIGPALERLATQFASPADYRQFWHDHPALSAVPRDLLDAYADYDIRQEDDHWRSKVSREAVLADARDTLVDPDVRQAVERLTVPTTMLCAERGMLDGPTGLYPTDRISVILDPLPHVHTRMVPDTNHYTISLSPQGSAAIADSIADALTT